MKKTYVIDRTGEVITANVEGDYEVSEKDAKIIERKRRERKTMMRGNAPYRNKTTKK